MVEDIVLYTFPKEAKKYIKKESKKPIEFYDIYP